MSVYSGNKMKRSLRRISGVTLSRTKILALLILALAAITEVYIHTSRYRINVPTRDLDAPFHTTGQEPPDPNDRARARASAALVMLVRNEELDGALKTVASVERKFNRW